MRYLNYSNARFDLSRASEQATDALIPWFFVPASRHRAAAQGVDCAWPASPGSSPSFPGQSLGSGIRLPMTNQDLDLTSVLRNEGATMGFRCLRGDAGWSRFSTIGKGFLLSENGGDLGIS